jgi:hypothetical protein
MRSGRASGQARLKTLRISKSSPKTVCNFMQQGQQNKSKKSQEKLFGKNVELLFISP